MAGISGRASGLVAHVFRLLRTARPTWLVLENVRNMLVLDQGRAMRYLVDELERRGYRWAYRLVDTRATGLPQRRQRVLLVASRTEDPAAVLFSDDAGKPLRDNTSDDVEHGFYWTEGYTGLGWARDAVPTLKGGSTIGIPSPPAIWVPGAEPGRRLVVPDVRDAEALQGFPRGWTSAADGGRRNGPRWKLVGNAVTVDVSAWLGRHLASPSGASVAGVPSPAGARWPAAAYGHGGRVWAMPVSAWPIRARYKPLGRLVDVTRADPLSERAVAGFRRRMERSRLRFDPAFRADVLGHELAWRDAAEFAA
jgi:DNA (cytosine-5)-methyltransferase 1